MLLELVVSDLCIVNLDATLLHRAGFLDIFFYLFPFICGDRYDDLHYSRKSDAYSVYHAGFSIKSRLISRGSFMSLFAQFVLWLFH